MRPDTAARNALWAVTAVIWVAIGRLALAFLHNELQWSYVAGQSRRDAPWYYRLAGVWGGSEGSLLLFAGVVGLLASVSARSLRRPAVLWFGAVTVTSLAMVDLVWASPFDRLAAPALRGFGLTPILEHPAMAVHPPLLYVGLACSLAAAMTMLDGGDPTRWLRRALGLITLAMALGGLWSYVEQGWGGYWAWDPVENTSLLVWLATVVALHLPARPRLGVLPWGFTLLGACLVRSGATPSIHGFAERASVGWTLSVVTAASAMAVVALSRHSAGPPRSGSSTVPVPVPVVAATAVLLLVAAGTLAPLVADLFGGRPAAVRGAFFSRTVGPVALVALPFLVARLRTPRARLVHVGVLVLVIGIAATTFDREQQVGVGPEQTVSAAGLSLTGHGVAVEPGPRPDVQAVVASVTVEGVAMRPSLVAYPERGGVLAETAVFSRPWRDVQVTLLSANDAGFVRLVVRQRPLMWAVWCGALLTAVGALSPDWRRRRRPPAGHASSPAAR
ncbi:MAG: cytochrome c-type biogenesis CcmF C-terminal domain-containing protein [Ilumatobacteraceae bacterium]